MKTAWATCLFSKASKRALSHAPSQEIGCLWHQENNKGKIYRITGSLFPKGETVYYFQSSSFLSFGQQVRCQQTHWSMLQQNVTFPMDMYIVELALKLGWMIMMFMSNTRKGLPFRMRKCLDQPVCFLPSYPDQRVEWLRAEGLSVPAKLYPSICLGSFISCSRGKEAAEDGWGVDGELHC